MSARSETAAGSSLSCTIADPMFRPLRSLEAASRNRPINATASSGFMPFVYCGHGCVVISPAGAFEARLVQRVFRLRQKFLGPLNPRFILVGINFNESRQRADPWTHLGGR